MIDTVMFDIGGTLIKQSPTPERTATYARYIITRLSEHGIHICCKPEDLSRIVNQRAEEYKHWGEEHRIELPNARIWNEFILKDFNIGEEALTPISEELSFAHDFIRLNTMPREALVPTIERLSAMGMKLGVITNTISESFGMHILKQYRVLHYFQDIVTSIESGIRKPDPKVFEYAMKRLGSTRETSCYVGDTISRDVLGSRNAGLRMAIKINNPSAAHRDAAFRGTDSPRPDYTVDRLDEIPQIIEDFNRKETT